MGSRYRRRRAGRYSARRFYRNTRMLRRVTAISREKKVATSYNLSYTIQDKSFTGSTNAVAVGRIAQGTDWNERIGSYCHICSIYIQVHFAYPGSTASSQPRWDTINLILVMDRNNADSSGPPNLRDIFTEGITNLNVGRLAVSERGRFKVMWHARVDGWKIWDYNQGRRYAYYKKCFIRQRYNGTSNTDGVNNQFWLFIVPDAAYDQINYPSLLAYSETVRFYG